jgi:hypothetical protein
MKEFLVSIFSKKGGGFKMRKIMNAFFRTRRDRTEKENK